MIDHPPHVRRCAAAVAASLGVEPSLVLSRRRDRQIVLARHIVAYALRTTLDRSYPELAREMGFADHTSAMHAVKRVAELRDAHTLTAVAVAKRALGAQIARASTDNDWWARETAKSEEVRRAG